MNLVEEIKSKKSFLCVGLDSDITKIPKHLLNEENPILEFNKAIIDATKDYCVSYKINTAFYEAMGVEGWSTMQQTLEYIPKNIFTIADAKRGDIGNTGEQYAKAFFENMEFDSVTVAPYMGKDSIIPFLKYENKYAIVLALTSNEGAKDFQFLEKNGQRLYEKVLVDVSKWGSENNLMFVIGATKAAELESVRKIVPNNFLLVPGVGTQGGSLQEVFKYGANANIGLLVNVSRAIIYASTNENFAEQASFQAEKYQKEMEELMLGSRII